MIDAMQTPQPYVLPSVPGYWGLEAIRPKDSRADYAVIRIPVAGWETSDEPGSRIVLISIYDISFPDGFPILGPDGRVCCDGRIFDSEYEWLEDVKARDKPKENL